MRQPASLLQGLERAGILAVLRAPSADQAVRAVDALVVGGVLGIEIIYSTPDAADVIAEAERTHGGHHLSRRRHRVDSRPGP
jgi:2-dehydro-3-deoxyphosphogluconate aldolase / (4S)-4-hydroxy-2-oxoglutarate aldolase